MQWRVSLLLQREGVATLAAGFGGTCFHQLRILNMGALKQYVVLVSKVCAYTRIYFFAVSCHCSPRPISDPGPLARRRRSHVNLSDITL